MERNIFKEGIEMTDLHNNTTKDNLKSIKFLGTLLLHTNSKMFEANKINKKHQFISNKNSYYLLKFNMLSGMSESFYYLCNLKLFIVLSLFPEKKIHLINKL